MYYTGCDIHDKTSHLQHLDSDGAIGLSKVVQTTKEGFTNFLELLDEPTIMTLEASCSYWWISQFLSEHPMVDQVHVIDPRRSRKVAEELSVLKGYGRASNDRIDAEMAAELSRRALAPTIHLPTEEQLKARTLNRFRIHLVREKSSTIRYCHSLLKMHGIYIATSEFLNNRASQQKVIQSVPDYVQFIIEKLLNQITQFEEQIPELEAQLDSVLPASHRIIKRLLTVPGIGIVIARTILTEIFDIMYFKAPKYLMSYSGLAIFDLDSDGRKKGTIKLNPYCNHYLKYAFVQAAHCARNHPHFRKPYERDVKKHGKIRAKLNLARRLVKAVYWMLTRQQAFKY
jgi:transposase